MKNSKKLRINKDLLNRIWNVLKKCAVPAAAIFLYWNGVFSISNTPNSMFSITGYDDAISAVTKSSMFSGDKQEAISYIEANASSESYRAVISIANSSMCSSDKCEAIRSIFV